MDITTTGVDLSATIPMTLCQDVILEPGSQYTLSFDIFTHLVTQQMTARAYLNNILLTSLYIPTNCTFKKNLFTFFASQSLNTFCFNETHSATPPFPYYPNYGGLIDNISLIKIST